MKDAPRKSQLALGITTPSDAHVPWEKVGEGKPALVILGTGHHGRGVVMWRHIERSGCYEVLFVWLVFLFADVHFLFLQGESAGWRGLDILVLLSTILCFLRSRFDDGISVNRKCQRRTA